MIRKLTQAVFSYFPDDGVPVSEEAAGKTILRRKTNGGYEIAVSTYGEKTLEELLLLRDAINAAELDAQDDEDELPAILDSAETELTTAFNDPPKHFRNAT